MIGREIRMNAARTRSLKKQNKINNKTFQFTKSNRQNFQRFPTRIAHSPFDSKLRTLGFNLLQLGNTSSTVQKDIKPWLISRNQIVAMVG